MEDKYKWKPWVDFKPEVEDPETLQYRSVPSLRQYRRLQYDGVVCCHSDDMEHDFSCFKEVV